MVQINYMVVFCFAQLLDITYLIQVMSLLTNNWVEMSGVVASSKELTVLFVLYTIVFYFRMYRDGKRYFRDIAHQKNSSKRKRTRRVLSINYVHLYLLR